jgi:uncharacterized membrane protein YphA (DoxX/SURF4 family)
MSLFRRSLSTNASVVEFLIRLILGVVFLSERLHNFLFSDAQGVGRFTEVGFPAPDVMAPFVGVCEITCAVLFALGMLTRFVATIPLLVVMLVAISTTYVSLMLIGVFWRMAHETRIDYTLLVGSVFRL